MTHPDAPSEISDPERRLLLQVAGQIYGQLAGRDVVLPEEICREIAQDALRRAEIFLQVAHDEAPRLEHRAAA